MGVAGTRRLGRREPKHRVTIWYPPGESDVTEAAYELECDICKVFASADSEDQADVMARLHEIFKATEVGERRRAISATAAAATT